MPWLRAFFSNLKNELTWHQSFQTRAEARAAVFDYIELLYNRKRIHQTLGYVSPTMYKDRVTLKRKRLRKAP